MRSASCLPQIFTVPLKYTHLLSFLGCCFGRKDQIISLHCCTLYQEDQPPSIVPVSMILGYTTVIRFNYLIEMVRFYELLLLLVSSRLIGTPCQTISRELNEFDNLVGTYLLCISVVEKHLFIRGLDVLGTVINQLLFTRLCNRVTSAKLFSQCF